MLSTNEENPMRAVQPGCVGPLTSRRRRWLAPILLSTFVGLGAAHAQPAAKPQPPPPKGAEPAVQKAPTPTETPAEATVPKPPASEVVARMQKFYEGTTTLRAKFIQTLSGPMGKRQAAGQVVLKKPGKMRWDYEKPERKLFIADGTTLWVYEPEDEQAYKQPLTSSQLPAQVSFLFGRGRLQDEFDASYLDGPPLGEPGDLVLKLLPKVASASYRHIVFVVNPKTFMVKETVLYDQQGGSNHIIFSGIEINPRTGVDDARFSFTPPANTKIITPR